MALFESKKKNTASKDDGSKEKKPQTKSPAGRSSYGVLKHPRITEKATFVSEENNVYTFDVAVRANKAEIIKSVKDIYGVVPVKVNIVSIPGKRVFLRGKSGKKAAGKKAYVYLKDGDKIEFA
jgi:large subunit ribosomal protein L23